MKISLLIFVLLYQIIYNQANSDLKQYLKEQTKVVNEKLNQYKSGYFTIIKTLNNIEISGNYSNGSVFSFFNTTFVILDFEIYKIAEKQYKKVYTFLFKENITIVKSIESPTKGFLLVTTAKGTLHLIGFDRNTHKISKIHNLAHMNVSDANFFQNGNDIFLLVSCYKTQDLSYNMIYKFTTTHFDQIEKFVTMGLTKIYTFGSNGSQIIITLQKFQLCSIFKFKYDQIKKIQKIDDPYDEVIEYKLNNNQYLIFIGKTVDIYLWTGTSLQFLKTVTVKISGAKTIFYINEHPYLFVTNYKTLFIYSLSNETISSIYKSMHEEGDKKFLLYYLPQNKNGTVLILTISQNNIVKIATQMISIQINSVGDKFIDNQELSSCFLHLEKAIYVLRNKLSTVENRPKSRTREAVQSETQFPVNQWTSLHKKYEKIKTIIENQETNILVVDDNAVVNIPNGAINVTAKDIHFETLNNHTWQPNKWFSYKVPQIINATVKAKNTEVGNLVSTEALFTDLILSTGKQIWSGDISINNIKVNQLETKIFNEIPVENFYYKSQPTVIQGLKTFPRITVQKIKCDTMNGLNPSKIKNLLDKSTLLKSGFDVNVTIENLIVDYVNGIDLKKFQSSVFRLGLDNTIEGNLFFKNLEATNISAERISNMTNVLTVSTKQTIKSQLHLSKILAENLTTNTVNNINLKKSVAVVNGNITGPITVKHLNVKNNLQLEGVIDNDLLLFNNTHIVGTNESDFLQIYHKKVQIKGNVVVKNLDIAHRAKLFVAGKEYEPSFDQFWSKTAQQKIPVHFVGENDVSTSHLFTNYINNIDTQSFFLNSTILPKPGIFHFTSVVIKGDVILTQNGTHLPNLEAIKQNSVKINGIFKINGTKTYTTMLKVDSMDAVEVVNKSGNVIKHSETNFMKNLTVKGTLNSTKIFVKKLNNINLEELTAKTIFINKPNNLSTLNFENVTANNLTISKSLNQLNISELLFKIKKMEEENFIDVYVYNNVTIHNLEKASKINDHKISHLMANSITKNGALIIKDKLKFNNNLKIRDFKVSILNGINLQELSNSLLYKSWNQTIKVPYNFTAVASRNLITDLINSYNVSNLIDVTNLEPQSFIASNGLNFQKPIAFHGISGNVGCDLNQGLRSLHHPKINYWKNLKLTGNVTFWDKNAPVTRIFNDIITNSHKSQNFNAKVQFLNNISINNVIVNKTVNNINIKKIIDDAVLNNSENQIITSNKTFIQFQAKNLENSRNTNVTVVNNINLKDINNKIISRKAPPDVPVKGQKVFFGGLQVKHLLTDLLSGVEPKNIVSSETSTTIPEAVFDLITITNNLNLEFINGMPFEVFLNERLLKKTEEEQTVTGIYYFNDLTFDGNITTPHINDLKIKNIIFDSDICSIDSPKKFTTNVKIFGNISVQQINGLQIAEAYEQAALITEDTKFTGTINILKPVFMEGNIKTEFINSYPITYMLDTKNNYSVNIEVQKINEIANIISVFTSKYFKATINMPTHILYLEKSLDLNIMLPNAKSAQVQKTKNELLIYINTEENGNMCGLPEECICPMQQIIQIPSEHSISAFTNKAMQRIYSYHDENIIIHLITHSISSSATCSTSESQLLEEITSISWDIVPNDHNKGGFIIHKKFLNGYINGVQFFTINNKTYIVIGTYYDPISSSHHANVIMFTFNADKTEIEEIQRIPCHRLKTISLFPSVQGVILILENDVSNNATNTKIYRFHYDKQQFTLLKRVPTFGGLFAQGAVIKTDSFIILANKQSNLLVLKYYPKTGNYHLYQKFQLNNPVSFMTVFYSKDYGISDAYLCVVTENNHFYIYSHKYIEGWTLEFSGGIEGSNMLIPLQIKHKLYLLAPSSKGSSLLTLVENDSN